ncbi:MAG: hypothetical protein GF353_16345 [Candidatus Lokiarchaeota archaeon]|nr:hypothetical protein [Candidatus Lokiarchaeota archaeon]
MSEEDAPDQEDVKEERNKLNKMGVSSTWNMLESYKKKEKNENKKKEFRGFK